MDVACGGAEWPFEDSHASHGTVNDDRYGMDAEVVEYCEFCKKISRTSLKVSCIPYIIADGCRREFGAIWSLGVRIHGDRRG